MNYLFYYLLKDLKEFGYILKGPLLNPGPGNYKSESSIKSQGFSIRPKTAN